MSDKERSLLPGVAPSQSGQLGGEIVPEESHGRGEEEDNVEGEKTEDREVEIEA